MGLPFKPTDVPARKRGLVGRRVRVGASMAHTNWNGSMRRTIKPSKDSDERIGHVLRRADRGTPVCTTRDLL